MYILYHNMTYLHYNEIEMDCFKIDYKIYINVVYYLI